ncbi:hypothetical protein F8154_11325 [Alkaliphilus pronyensis]|uniref:Uncharacterized protein n=1 Tax=Alkaliphilus pronyensis TaxID=1482732 RepID=A0A6I0F908_9FIRM|nr:hypothetical protein [Alkaliphilus pronyensis]KAB3532872.1 hypothetical protein F8154_11325 [Alkaliphilus pronyensis]
MDSNKTSDQRDPIINNSFIQKNWLLLVPAIMMASKKIPEAFNLNDVDTGKLEKKIRLLNRIKGYMSPEEQIVLHRSEVILHIIVKVKSLMDISRMQNHETKYHSLSVEDRKRYMLMDIAEFVEDEKRDVIHRAIELNLKANMMGTKVKEIQGLSNEITIENLERYIQVFEPLLEGDLKNKTREVKVLLGFLKLMKAVSNKETIDEMDMLNIIKPMVNEEQGESLIKMIQIVKALSEIGNEESKGQNNKELPNPLDNSDDLEVKDKPTND